MNLLETKKEMTAIEATTAVNPEEAGLLFAMTPDDETRTMIIFPMGEGQTSIKLNETTGKMLIEMLERQMREWSQETAAAEITENDKRLNEFDKTRGIGPVVKDLGTIIDKYELSFREFTLLSNEARRRKFPYPRSNSEPTDITQLTSNPENFKKTLEHFGLTNNPDAEYWHAYGPEKSFLTLKFLPGKLGDREKKKFRFAYYYDPEFPFTLTEITED